MDIITLLLGLLLIATWIWPVTQNARQELLAGRGARHRNPGLPRLIGTATGRRVAL